MSLRTIARWEYSQRENQMEKQIDLTCQKMT